MKNDFEVPRREPNCRATVAAPAWLIVITWTLWSSLEVFFNIDTSLINFSEAYISWHQSDLFHPKYGSSKYTWHLFCFWGLRGPFTNDFGNTATSVKFPGNIFLTACLDSVQMQWCRNLAMVYGKYLAVKLLLASLNLELVTTHACNWSSVLVKPYDFKDSYSCWRLPLSTEISV